MIKTKLGGQKGQALLIVILVMVVALTITLSVISRAVVNLRTTQDQEKSQRALAAAEAGIEQTIKNSFVPIAQDQNLSNNSSFTTSVTQLAGNAPFLVEGGNLITKNEGEYIWLSTYNEVGNWTTRWPTSGSANLDIYWGDSSGDNNNAALEIAVISGSSVANAVITRYVYDPSPTRRSSNNFSAPVNSPIAIQDKSFTYRATISITDGMVVRVVPLYKSAYIAAAPASGAPAIAANQGRLITAVGKSDETARRVTVFQGYPELPADFFPYSLLVP